MATITRTTKAGGGTNFNSGQTIDPTEVNTDFNTAYTEINGLLDDGNIETATIPGAKSLRFTEIAAPASPSANDVLLYALTGTPTSRLNAKDAGGTVLEFVGVIDRDTSQAEVVSTAAETTVYTYAVAANLLGTNRQLRLTLLGDFLNNTGADRTVQLRVKYGATAFCTGSAFTATTSATRRFFFAQSWLQAANATNAQIGFTREVIGAAGVTGAAVAIQLDEISGHNAIAEDSTGALNLVATIQLSLSDANLSFRLTTAVLELA